MSTGSIASSLSAYVSSNIAFESRQCACGNALYAAAAGDHETVVWLLVTAGVGVNAQSGE
jgi:hypothetical protein